MLWKNKKRKKKKIISSLVREYITIIAISCLPSFLVLFMYWTGISMNIGRELYNINYDLYRFCIEYAMLFTIASPFILFIVQDIFLHYKHREYTRQLIDAIEKLNDEKADQINLSPDLQEVKTNLDNIIMRNELNQRRMKEEEQRKNDLVVYLAHDLKTPLTSIIGYLSLLTEEKEISISLREKYENIALEKSYRLEDLINEFFDITRYNLQTMQLEYTKVDLKILLEQLVEEFYPVLQKKDLEISLKCDQSVILEVDANKMARVFDNLLKNAVSYCYEKTTIEIIVVDQEDSWAICFINKGPKIPESKLELIFEKFYRVDESRSSVTGGSGVGLAVAKKIVENHHGTLIAKSDNEKTEFIVTLLK